MAARRILAARDMPAERRRAAALDRAHHLQLVEAHMPAVGFTPSRAMVAEDIRDLQGRTGHDRGRLCGRLVLLVLVRVGLLGRLLAALLVRLR